MDSIQLPVLQTYASVHGTFIEHRHQARQTSDKLLVWLRPKLDLDLAKRALQCVSTFCHATRFVVVAGRDAFWCYRTCITMQKRQRWLVNQSHCSVSHWSKEARCNTIAPRLSFPSSLVCKWPTVWDSEANTIWRGVNEGSQTYRSGSRLKSSARP